MSDNFDTLNLIPELLSNLESLNFKKMTPIQKESLPLVLAGKDVIARAKTGSGKTAAFALGVLNSLVVNESYPQCFILTPTRELADQVATEVRLLARALPNVKVVTICGGTAEFHQDKSLSHGAHIVVGTPGRILKLLKKKTLDPRNVKTFVLDEADRMLDMGFTNELKEIERFIPKKRQSLLFSATFPYSIEDLSKNIQTDAVMVKVDTEIAKNIITETFYELDSHKDKNEALLAILGELKPQRFIIFCKTKIITDSLVKFLDAEGVICAGIHGDIEQNERLTTLAMFKNNSISGLIATDVAARGLDIKELPAVFNYDLPIDSEDYVHRIGRTGRAGESGIAISLSVEKEAFKIEKLEEYLERKVKVEKFNFSKFTNSYDILPPMDTMYISGGKKEKLRPGDIVGALIHEAGLESDDIGDITITNITSLVAIKKEKIKEAIEKLNAGKIKNKKFKVGLA